MEKMVQKSQYITRKGTKRKGDEKKKKKQEKSEKLKKDNSKKKKFHIIDHTIRAYPRMLFIFVRE